MPLTPRTRSVAVSLAMRNSLHLIVVIAIAAACSRDENPTPTPPGAASKELTIAGAPVVIGVGDIAVCGTAGDEATGALVDSLLRLDSAQRIQDVVLTFGDNAYPSGSQGVSNDFPRCFSPS